MLKGPIRHRYSYESIIRALRRQPREMTVIAQPKEPPAGNSPRCHHQLLFLSYWPLTGPLPTLNYLISIVLKHPHKLSGALKLSSTVSDMAGGGGWGRGVVREGGEWGERINKVSVLPSISLLQYSALWVPHSKCLCHNPCCLAIDFHITLLYVFIYFIYFFLNIIDDPQEDGRTGAFPDVNSQSLPYPPLWWL